MSFSDLEQTVPDDTISNFVTEHEFDGWFKISPLKGDGVEEMFEKIIEDFSE